MFTHHHSFRKVPLTEAQRRLAGDNLGLVGCVIRQLLEQGGYVVLLGEDDARSVGYLALCKAAREYKPGRGRFSTYAGRAIRTEVRAEAHRWTRLRAMQLFLYSDDLVEEKSWSRLRHEWLR